MAMYTYIMRRTQIYLSDEETQALERERRKTGASRSELIRGAIDDKFLNGRSLTTEERLGLLERSRGAWKGRTETGEQYVERIRSGRLARLHGWRK